jgi:hypothetical protein
VLRPGAGPDSFRFSVDDEFDALFREHGLQDRVVKTVAFTHSAKLASGRKPERA